MHVKIYLTEHCPFCVEAVGFLKKLGLTVEEVNVARDRECLQEMMGQGGIATPFIVIGSKVFHVFDPQKIQSYLKEAT